MRATGQKENDGRLPGRKAVRALRRALLAACAVLAACQAGARPWEGAGLYEASYADGDVAVTASYGKEAGIPEGAELRARLKTGEAAEQALAEAGAEDSLEAAVCGIGFYKGEEEIEPKAPVSVAVQVKDGGFAAGEPVEVVHLGEDGAETLGDTKADGDGRASFVTDGFSDFVFITKGRKGFMTMANPGTGNEESDLKKFVSEVTIKDSDGNVIKNEGGTLYVGENYDICLKFREKGATGLQFDTSGTLTYQIPKNFQVEPQYDQTLKIIIDGKEVEIGTYTIDVDGKLTVTLNDTGKEELKRASNATLQFDMKATAQAVEGDDKGKVHFGDTGEDFNFEIVDQPRVSVEKNGKYTENGERTGGTLEYTVKTTVEHGEVENVVVQDVLTPPQTTDAFTLEMKKTETGKPDVTVKVKVKKADGSDEIIELEPDEYELLPVGDNPENPYDKAFQVKLNEPYAQLNEGDELYVTYNYNVNCNKGSINRFWGNVVNDVTVTGKMQVEDPSEPGKYTESPFEKHESSNVEIQVTPDGNGVVCKDQSYSEATHTLHYTLYTVVPAGTWAPLYIYDDMVVEYNGKKWYIPVKDGGRVSGLTVKAVDLENSWTEGWTEDTKAGDKVEGLGAYIEKAETLKGFEGDYPNNSSQPDDYDPNDINQYVYMYGWHNLYIIFGCESGKAAGEWGHWNHGRDRLIITEYDLDMSGEEKITLTEMNGPETLTLSPNDVLLAGITNNVNLRYSGYYPGYNVFFNNADRMNKTGRLDKDTSTIEYTVTLNTTDTTVNKYFRDVAANLREAKWSYNGSMQAVFYDKLPYGWKYVEGSLTVTAKDKYGNIQTFSEIHPSYKDQINIVTKSSEPGIGDEINAPLALFYNSNGTGNDNANHESYNAFSEDLVQLTFIYKLKATDEWMKEHALEEAVSVHNHAEIKDKNITHWETDETVQYFPARLTKQAKQVGTSNLLQFTLKVNNPEAADLDEEKDYLIVTDTSTNIQIQTDSIVVTDAEGNDLGPDKWRILPSESDGQFQLEVPDSMALLITYDARILEEGDDVSVSNKASIDGVTRSDSGYEGSLKVSEVQGSGAASVYKLTIRKTDKTNSKQLADAKFRFYIVIPEETTEETESGLKANAEVTIDGKKYQCYSGNGEDGEDENWEFTTDENGLHEVVGWKLEPGNYYILEETEAPKGYEKLEPILFYYGPANGKKDDTSVQVIPVDGTLEVKDPPIEYELPETGGPGTTAAAFLGMLLILSGGVTLLVRRKRSAG